MHSRDDVAPSHCTMSWRSDLVHAATHALKLAQEEATSCGIAAGQSLDAYDADQLRIWRARQAVVAPRCDFLADRQSKTAAVRAAGGVYVAASADEDSKGRDDDHGMDTCLQSQCVHSSDISLIHTHTHCWSRS